MKFGFIKIAAAVPTVKVGDCEFNLQQIESIIAQAEGKGVEIIVFPELSLTGYSCQDLFRQHLLLDAAEAGNRWRFAVELCGCHPERSDIGYSTENCHPELWRVL